MHNLSAFWTMHICCTNAIINIHRVYIMVDQTMYRINFHKIILTLHSQELDRVTTER